jgi:hypothetical protein
MFISFSAYRRAAAFSGYSRFLTQSKWPSWNYPYGVGSDVKHNQENKINKMTCELMLTYDIPLFGKQEVGIWRVKKRFPRYGTYIKACDQISDFCHQ